MAMKRDDLLRNFHQAKWDEPCIYELGTPGERGQILPEIEEEIEAVAGDVWGNLPSNMRRAKKAVLPEMAEMQVLRHYLRVSQQTLGADLNVDIGQGTCTMKYSPKVNEKITRSPKMTETHPLQDDSTVQGTLEAVHGLDEILQSVSGMDKFTFQPGGGSQAILTIATMMKAYHEANGEGDQRDEIITTIFSHPSNAAAPKVKGYKIITLYYDENGVPDFEALKEYADAHRIPYSSNEDLIKLKQIDEMMQKEFGEFQRKLASYEKVRKFTLLSQPFTIEAGEMTPSLKLKRNVIEDRYKELIEDMYDGLEG